MAQKKPDTTEANRRISRPDDAGEALPEGNDDVTRANQKISRADDGAGEDELRRDHAVLRPPD